MKMFLLKRLKSTQQTVFFHGQASPGRAWPAFRHRGFTLVEVLVTVVILTIGLLGVAGLQLSALKGNQSALHMSIAVALAAEGADRIRANLPGVSNSYDLITAAGSSDVDCIKTSTGCSSAELAQHDAYEWITSIENQLPGGQGALCRDTTPYDGTGSGEPACDGATAANGLNLFAVKVWWDDDRDPATPKAAYRISLVP